MSAGDALNGQQFWRAHPNDRPFSRADATSREWASHDEPDTGYSAFRTPHELFGYFHPGERDRNESHVIAFRGHVVGQGMDGEPLVVPHEDEPDVRLDWKSARNLVGKKVVRQINKKNGWN
jgi:hypothetical protein